VKSGQSEIRKPRKYQLDNLTLKKKSNFMKFLAWRNDSATTNRSKIETLKRSFWD